MKKAELMRDALTRNNTWCKANPELFIVWVEKGHIQIEATGEASFMYHYTIQVLVVDFPGQIDDLMLPLLAWAWQQQPDLLLNPDNNRKVEFDADIVNDDVADILFKVPVWERVMVTNSNGAPKAEHLAESRPRFNGGEWEMVFDPESGGELV
ncbi:phage tail protein [Klebsiella quasipneumoniae]|uniref:phage tail protein n=1 Tax=Klebsiella pneumoniae complex TaxID=3390273 RepID=UPI0002C41B14|nr:phage tail protein [Klebsiella quasipneumoniae]AMR15399.1 phage tail protein [Klebsiella quasipneumoniae]AVF88776.1 phage tail protein [Klebsiella quasipneumoniae]AWO59702.1 phage tail protein [Klebsiella quasipneumoniae subsp. similipneumoniae]EMR24988.1 phage tail completion protein R [Klebsiella quasipneumoniae]MBK5762135.1 phage tail protein [Klebsiella quasipneumoniae]